MSNNVKEMMHLFEHIRIVLFGAVDPRSTQFLSIEVQARSQKMVETFNTIKQVIWNCARVDGDGTGRSQIVNIGLLIQHMNEIRTRISIAEMGLRVIHPSWEASGEDTPATEKELRRFSLINPKKVWQALCPDAG